MLIAGALLASAGCDSQGQQGDQKKKAEKSEAEEPKEAEQEQEQSDEEEDEEQAETEAEYAEEDYVQASYELSCVESELSEDEVEFEKVEKDILGKYGFDQKTYESADEEYGESDEVSGKIDSKLEDCTTEQARQFAGMGEQEESEKEDSGEKQGSEKAEGSSGSPKPANVGTMSKTIEGSAGFERAELKVTVREDFSANGTFSGRREGKGFRISLDGKVSDDNDLSLSGSSGKNDVSVDGKLKESGTKAKVSGSLWERQFTTTMSLN